MKIKLLLLILVLLSGFKASQAVPKNGFINWLIMVSYRLQVINIFVPGLIVS